MKNEDLTGVLEDIGVEEFETEFKQAHRPVRRETLQVDLTPVLLEMHPLGLLVIDKHLTVRAANRLAKVMLTTGYALTLDRDQKLVTRDVSHRQLFAKYLQSLLGNTSADKTSPPLRYLIKREYGPPVVVMGRTCLGREGHTRSPCAILSLNDLAQPLFTGDQDVLRDALRLTQGEANLATALLGGKTLAEFSNERAVSFNTARTILRRVLDKAGLKRQAEFIRIYIRSRLS